jgi:hypothetical protein
MLYIAEYMYECTINTCRQLVGLLGLNSAGYTEVYRDSFTAY